MHELSLSGAIVDTVEKHAAGRRVSVVTMRVGALRQVVPETLDFYFSFVAKGTVCESARLDQKLVPGQLRCAACGNEWEMDLPVFTCAGCGDGGRVGVSAGNEFEVESIVVEEDACIAPR